MFFEDKGRKKWRFLLKILFGQKKEEIKMILKEHFMSGDSGLRSILPQLATGTKEEKTGFGG